VVEARGEFPHPPEIMMKKKVDTVVEAGLVFLYPVFYLPIHM